MRTHQNLSPKFSVKNNPLPLLTSAFNLSIPSPIPLPSQIRSAPGVAVVTAAVWQPREERWSWWRRSGCTGRTDYPGTASSWSLGAVSPRSSSPPPGSRRERWGHRCGSFPSGRRRPPRPSRWWRSPGSCPCSAPAAAHSQRSLYRRFHTSDPRPVRAPPGTEALRQSLEHLLSSSASTYPISEKRHGWLARDARG